MGVIREDTRSLNYSSYMVSSQNYGYRLYYGTEPNILGYQKEALILGTTHIPRATTIRVRALRGFSV